MPDIRYQTIDRCALRKLLPRSIDLDARAFPNAEGPLSSLGDDPSVQRRVDALATAAYPTTDPEGIE